MNIEKIATYLNSCCLPLKVKKRLTLPFKLFMKKERYKQLRRLLVDNYDEMIVAKKGVFFNEKGFNEEIKQMTNHSAHESSLSAFVEINLKRIKPKKQWNFMDAGCGTGFALWKASPFFSKVIGVEFMPQLADMAVENMQKLAVKNAEIITSDICKIPSQKLEEVNVFYMYNPFQGKIMETFIKNIVQSIRDKDRDVFVIYVNDVCADLLTSLGGGTLRLWKLIENKSWRNTSIYYHKGGSLE